METPTHARHEPTLWKPGLPSWNPRCVAANPIAQLRPAAPGDKDNLLCDVTRIAASRKMASVIADSIVERMLS
jgi:hypothetical protein